MLTPHATTEYGTLRRVAMRYAGDFTRALDGPDVHPVLARQQTTSIWTPYTPAVVRSQQDMLIGLLRSCGAEVVLLDDAPGCSAQHYPRDIAFVIDHVLVMARLNCEHRRPEADALARLLTDTPHVVHLDEGTIEGGDVMLHAGAVLVGLGEETSPAGIRALQKALTVHGVEREVRPVHFGRHAHELPAPKGLPGDEREVLVGNETRDLPALKCGQHQIWLRHGQVVQMVGDRRADVGAGVAVELLEDGQRHVVRQGDARGTGQQRAGGLTREPTGPVVLVSGPGVDGLHRLVGEVVEEVPHGDLCREVPGEASEVAACLCGVTTSSGAASRSGSR